jgi:DNA-binding PadR family transcriptional regulator
MHQDHWMEEDHRRRGGPRRGRGFGDPERMRFGRGSRAARGDVRAAILALLGESPMHGYQIIAELSDRTAGAWRPSPGSVYPTLQHLEEAGLVTSADQEGKRVFSLTDAGRAEVSARDAGRPKPWEEVGADADPSGVDLRAAIVQVFHAAREVSHAGSPAQVATAKAILINTRRELYKLLAEDDDTTV